MTTAVLVGKATFKAAVLIDEMQHRYDKWAPENAYYGPKEKIETVWKLYIPAALVGATTITAIIFANKIGTRRAAALASAYTLLEKGFVEYQEKVVEIIGEKKEEGFRAEVARDRVRENPVGSSEVIITGTGEQLCYEAYTGRYFRGDMETLRKAQNDINARVINNNYASLTDFYELVGLPKTHISDEIGWSTEKLLDLKFSATLAEDGKPCIAINFTAKPIRY